MTTRRIATIAMLVAAGPTLAHGQSKPQCIDDAADVLIHVPGAALARMDTGQILYSVSGGTVVALCDWTTPRKVRSFTIASRDVTAHRRLVEKIMAMHTSEPKGAMTRLIDRCIARAKKLNRPFQAVGIQTTLVCDHDPPAMVIYRRAPDDIEN